MAHRKGTVNGRLQRLSAAIIMLALCIQLTLLAACESNEAPTSGPELGSRLIPTPTPFVDVLPYVPYTVPPSLEEQVAHSVIVRASLASVTPGTETVSNGEGVASTYRPLQTLRFTVHEYLKGSGPSEAVVVVRGAHTYLTEVEARRAANRRNTTWDDREAVLFLSTPASLGAAGASVGSQSAGSFTFFLNNYTDTPFDYSVDTLSRVWLPARDAPGTRDPAGGSSTPGPYITDGAASPPPTASLADIKAAIANLEAEIERGAGIEGYYDCMRDRVTYERYRRAQPIVPVRETAMLASGSAASMELFGLDYRDPKYNQNWLSGPDMGLFAAPIVDTDSDPSNGYDHTITTARPLPADSYQFFWNFQSHTYIPCNFKPTDAYVEWTVTVTPPADTLHEAFFDPVDLTGGGVGASGSSGVIDPDEFTVSGDDYEIESLVWRSNSVVLTLDDHVSLSGYSLDFIELDGSIDTTLDVADATVDQTAATWTWTVTSAPWVDGDQLMLRIRETSTGTTIAPTATPTPTPTPVPPTATPTPVPPNGHSNTGSSDSHADTRPE